MEATNSSDETIHELAGRFHTLLADLSRLERLVKDNEAFRAAQNVRSSLGAVHHQVSVLLTELGIDATPILEMKSPDPVPPSFASSEPDSAA